MSNIIIAGSCYVVTSEVSMADLDLVKKYRPKALKLVDEETKEELFAVGTGSNSLNDYVISFGGVSNDEKKLATVCTGLGANKPNRARRDPRAAVCFSSDTYSITLRGRLEIVTDAAVKQENWYSGLENHFSGADDPNYCVLRFTTEKYNLFVDWEETVGETGL